MVMAIDVVAQTQNFRTRVVNPGSHQMNRYS